MAGTAQQPDRPWLGQATLPILILLAGIWLRAPAIWASTPLEVDEALYSTFARQISHENNPLLVGLDVDKPPLSLYTVALSFKLFTLPSEWAARLPNFFASILSIAVLWRLAMTLYRQRIIASLATTLLALSALDITHAASVFTDPQVTLWTLCAALAAVRGQGLTAGIFMGLAFASKQSALQALPLVAALGAIGGRFNRRALLHFAAVLIGMCLLPFGWEFLREPGNVGWWALGAVNNLPERLIRSDEVLPRLMTWARFLAAAAGSPANVALLILAVTSRLASRPGDARTRRAVAFDLVLAIYLVGYGLVYVLAAFALYPRYAHILAPIACLLIARWMGEWHSSVRHAGMRTRGLIILTGVLVLSSLYAHEAQVGETWLNDQRRAHAGIADTAVYLNSLPPGTIVYDRWTGWLLGWYTGQNRPANMWLRIVYYPTPESLIDGVLGQPDSFPRYFVVPYSAPARPWLAALQAAGLEPINAAEFGQYQVYRLLPP